MRRIIGTEADRASHLRGTPIVTTTKVRRYRLRVWSQRLGAAAAWFLSLYTGKRS